MDFKTNIKCEGCASAISRVVKRKFPDAEIKYELENTDKVMHVHGVPEDSEHAAEIESAIKEAGFEGSWIQQAQTGY